MDLTGKGAMEKRFATFGARIDELLGATTHSELVDALKGELTVWHEWIDEARVQAALGAMEGHDRVHNAMKTLESVYSRMRHQVDLVKDVADPVPGLEDAIRSELRGAKKELSSPEAFVGSGPGG